MADPESPRLLTAAELDEMSPDERSQAFRDRIVTNPATLPEDFRSLIEATARKLGTQATEAS